MITRLKAISPLIVCMCFATFTCLHLSSYVQACGMTPSTASSEAGWQKDDADSGDKVHTPAVGSAERKAVMDGLRGDQAAIVFKVHYLRVHGNWAFVDVTPIDSKGKPVAEGGASLMHKLYGVWKVIDLSILPEDPDNPMGPDDPTPKFVKAVQKKFPDVPADIFPSRARAK